jgi:hypothetical protein
MPWYLYLALKQLFPTGRRFPFFTFISMLGVALGVALATALTEGVALVPDAAAGVGAVNRCGPTNAAASSTMPITSRTTKTRGPGDRRRCVAASLGSEIRRDDMTSTVPSTPQRGLNGR